MQGYVDEGRCFLKQEAEVLWSSSTHHRVVILSVAPRSRRTCIIPRYTFEVGALPAERQLWTRSVKKAGGLRSECSG